MAELKAACSVSEMVVLKDCCAVLMWVAQKAAWRAEWKDRSTVVKEAVWTVAWLVDKTAVSWAYGLDNCLAAQMVESMVDWMVAQTVGTLVLLMVLLKVGT